MPAAAIESLTAPFPIQVQPESNHHRLIRDLTVAMIALELVAECEELAADLRCLVEAAHRRLLDCAEQLLSSEAEHHNTPPYRKRAAH